MGGQGQGETKGYAMRDLWRAVFFMSVAMAVSAGVVGPGAGAEEKQPPKSAQAGKQATIDEQFLFAPMRYPQGDWRPEGLRFQDIVFAAADGTQLHGWYCPADQARATVLVMHGNAGNVATRGAWLSYLQTRMRVNVFLFDYRGYGRSHGKPTVDGVLQDARAARAKLVELSGVPTEQLILMGESLGGAVAVQMASESACRALVLQSTFSSFRDAAQQHAPLLAWAVSRQKLNSVSAIAKYRGPLLQSHGTADEVIPLALGEKLFQAANEPKQFVRLAGAGHNNWLTEEYGRQLDAFLERVKR